MKTALEIPASLPKNVLFGGITIIIIAALIYALKFFKSFKNDGYKKTIDQAAKEVNKKKLSYPLSNYSTFADQILQAAYNSMWPGTDEETIYNVFKKLNNKDDVLQLIASYGVRKYHDLNIFPRKLGLGSLLHEELDDEEIENVNQILADNSINFKF